MPVNSTTRIDTVVSVVAEASYAVSPQDGLVVATEIPTGGTVVALPLNPSAGDAYEIADGDGSCSSGSPLVLTIDGPGQTIQGGSTLALSNPFAWARVTFSEPLRAWIAFVAGASVSRFSYEPLPYTTIYVDPEDETGHASDSNPGTSPGAPIATTAHLNAVNFFGALTGDTLIQYLSDDPSGTGVVVEYLALGTFKLTIAQTRQVLHVGGALNAGTIAIDPPANQPQVVHTTDVADFAPYVVTQNGGPATYGVRVTDTTTGAGAWIMSAAAPAAPKCTRPILPDGTAGALTIGHGYTLSRGGLLTLAAQTFPIGTPGEILFSDCAFLAASTGFDGAEYARCSWTGAMQVAATMSDCLMQADLGAAGSSSGAIAISAGGLITLGNTVWSGPVAMTGDVYVTGQAAPDADGPGGLNVGNGWLTALAFYSSDIGAGIQIHDSTGPGLVLLSSLPVALSAESTNPLLWGSGNAGYGVVVEGGVTLTVSSGVVPTLTGALGDFAFIGAGGVGLVALARAFDETGDDYTTLRATTWANFVASIADGGFAFQAHCVSATSSIVGV